MSDMSEQPQDSSEDVYALGAALVEDIKSAIDARDADRLHTLLDDLHTADIADLLEQIDRNGRAALIDLWALSLDPAVLAELEEGVRDEVIGLLTSEQIQEVAQGLESDDLVYLVEDLEEQDQERILDALDDADRVAVENSLAYPEHTAGRLMQRELVTAPEHWNVGQMIDHMRAEDDLPELFYDVIIVDPRLKPVGTVPLSAIMANKRDITLLELMHQEFRVISADQSQKDVAYAFNQYHMVSSPVVDDAGRLVGVITIDDAMTALDEEAEEDIKRLAGVGDEELSDRVWETTKLRFPWLAVNLVTSVLASIVIAQFAGTIEAIVALAVLMPIVASMGGNAGTQTLTVAVRAIATRDLTAANAWRIIGREALVGLLNGLVFAVIIGGVGLVWYGNPLLGVVLGLAMVANLFVAGVSGILVPLALDRLGIDPALASGAFVTTVTDVVGFFAFLSLAAAILL